MKLTPLGKLLLAIIGLAIIAVAVHLYLPDSLKPWKKAPGGPAPQAGYPASPQVPAAAPGAPPATAPPAATAQSAQWIRVPGGPIASTDGGRPIDVATFHIQSHEVTNRQYQAFLAECAVGSECGPRALPPYWDDVGYLDTHLDHPVVFVTWGDANAYARWAGARLPTIHEWELAAGGGSREYPWGDAPDKTAANILGPDRHDEKTKAPKQIATWPVNDRRMARDMSPFGVVGMAGNVSEWTASRSDAAPDLMVAAGGSWDSWDHADAKVTHRVPKPPTDRSSSLGFRCAKD